MTTRTASKRAADEIKAQTIAHGATSESIRKQIKAVDGACQEYPMMQCVDCWHRWQLKGYCAIEPCPQCGSTKLVNFKVLTANLNGDNGKNPLNPTGNTMLPVGSQQPPSVAI